MTQQLPPMPIAAVLTADWHLTRNTWRFRPEINEDAIESLRQVATFAGTEIPIIAAGDQFDTRTPSTGILQQLYQIMSHCHGFYINGNHDKVSPSWIEVVFPTGWPTTNEKEYSAPEPRHSTDMAGFVVELPPLFPQPGHWDAYGIEHVETREKLQERLDALKPPEDARARNLLVLHQGMEGLIPKMSVELFHGMIPDWVDVVLCGHIHMSKVESIQTSSGKTVPLVSPGSLHLCSIDEDPKKKLFVLGADGAIYSKRLTTRRVISLNVSNASESDLRAKCKDIVTTIKNDPKERPPAIQKPILRLTYNGATTPRMKVIIETALREEKAEAHIFCKDVAEKLDGNLQMVSEEGIDSVFDSSNLEYARAMFLQLEQNPSIRQIGETFFSREPTQESYDEAKKQYLTHMEQNNEKQS